MFPGNGGEGAKYNGIPHVPTVPISSIQGFRRNPPRNPYDNFDHIEEELFRSQAGDEKRNIRRTMPPHDDDLYRRLNEVAKGNANSPLENAVVNDKRVMKGLSDDEDDEVSSSSGYRSSHHKNRTSPRMSPRGYRSPRGISSLGGNSPRTGPAVTTQLYNAAALRNDSQSFLSSSLSVKQQNRFNEYMNASPPTHRQAQLKTLEYLQYWMCLPGTKALIDRAISDVKRECVVKQAWPSNSRDNSPSKDPQTSLTSLPSIHTPERRKSDPLYQNGSSSDGVPPFGKSIGINKAFEMGREGDKSDSSKLPDPLSSEVSGVKSGDLSPVPPKDADERELRRRKKLEKAEKKERKKEKKEKAEKRNEKVDTPQGLHPPPKGDSPSEPAAGSSTPPPAKTNDSKTLNTVGDKSNSPTKPVTPPRAATYNEIPQFYFPMGRPTLSESLISGPTHSGVVEDNPHLKLFDGVSFAAATVFDGGEGISTSTSALGREGEKSNKSVPMSTLKISKDENAHSHIQREFSRLPPVPKLNQKVRLLSGRMRNSSNAPLAKQEANYRHQLILCMQRLSTQCFGVPRYFSFIILKHIQSEMKTTANRGGNNTSSNSLLSGGAATQNIVTAQHVKDFYDKYLRGKDSPRRTFDLLVLSCSLANHELTNIPVTNLYLSPDTSELRTHLLPEDFIAYLECLLQHHPGLSFLHETPDFQIKYLDTVVYRIFYTLDRFDRGRISYSEFVNSTLLDAFRQVDASEDINSILQFFSYEHFYVLYCRFWELDEDRDMLISKEDFVHYAPEDVMNPIVVDRVFEGIGRRKHCKSENEMDYEDFVWFCLSEEDKSTFTSIRYWFRILDLDGDGILSVYELHLFYEATKNIIGQFIAEGLIGFEDVICQVFDMLRLSPEEGIRLGDLLREREAASVALNMLTNVIRFLQFEQRDPFVLHQERLIGGLEQTAWDRFARSEYDRMALEADD